MLNPFINMQIQVFCCHCLLLESLQIYPLPWQCMVVHKGCQISCCRLAVPTLWRRTGEEPPTRRLAFHPALHYVLWPSRHCYNVLFSKSLCSAVQNCGSLSAHCPAGHDCCAKVFTSKVCTLYMLVSTLQSLQSKVQTLDCQKPRQFWLFSVIRVRSAPPFFYSSFDSFSLSALRLLTV